MKNPYRNPLDGKTGNTQELLAELNIDELQLYIAHYRWRQANEKFAQKPRNRYQSESYFRYRTNQSIYEAQQLIVNKNTKH
jgi:hypothetical protein